MITIQSSAGSQYFQKGRSFATRIENKVRRAGQMNNDWICQVVPVLAQKCTR
jgi:hypothetical protein